MNWKCILTGHKWHQVGVEHFVDTSWGLRADSSFIFMTCDRCGLPKTKTVYGHFPKSRGDR